MISAFVAYRHSGEDPAELRPMLEAVCGALRTRGIDAYCTFFDEEEFQDKSLGPRAIMEHAFQMIDNRDFLFIVQTSSSKSEGMLMEVGYCWGTSKPIIVAVKDDVDGTYVPDMATASFSWSSPIDLRQSIADMDIRGVLAKVGS